MDIKEIRKKLPIGSINKIAEKTGASVGTINRFFEGKKIKPDVQLSILKATTSPKSYLTDYIQSPKYRERLVSSGYSNPDKVIEDRLERVKNTKINRKKAPKGSFYKDGELVADKVQADTLGVSLDNIIVHELGHTETDNPEGVSSGMFTPFNDLSAGDQEEIVSRQFGSKRLKEWEEAFTKDFLSKRKPDNICTEEIKK